MRFLGLPITAALFLGLVALAGWGLWRHPRPTPLVIAAVALIFGSWAIPTLQELSHLRQIPSFWFMAVMWHTIGAILLMIGYQRRSAAILSIGVFYHTFSTGMASSLSLHWMMLDLLVMGGALTLCIIFTVVESRRNPTRRRGPINPAPEDIVPAHAQLA